MCSNELENQLGVRIVLHRDLRALHGVRTANDRHLCPRAVFVCRHVHLLVRSSLRPPLNFLALVHSFVYSCRMRKFTALTGDSRVRLREFPESSFDSIVTDPPYELGFMGKGWDSTGISYEVRLWEECLRVLKPGGYLLSFGGSRTYHRMACAIEDAGFEIRDQIMWIYGSGFPKSLNVSKMIDKAAGAERSVLSQSKAVKRMIPGADQDKTGWIKDNGREFVPSITAAATDEAKQWEGWGTALKPAHEPIVVARKPLIGTVVANVLLHGTGALNIDGCRVGTESIPSNKLERWSGFGQVQSPAYTQTLNTGRWPANVIHDGSEEVVESFPDAPGQLMDVSDQKEQRKTSNVYGTMKRGSQEASANNDNEGAVGFKMKPGARRIDTGTSARFFYCAKANSDDRHTGNHHPGDDSDRGNHHPTVKPVDLMQYLCRLVTPPDGTVLDPFMGSGSTGKAALREGFKFVGIEIDPEYVAIAERRIVGDNPLFNQAEAE